MRYLVILVKEPRPGRVKTRLGREIGMTAAAWWYRHNCGQLMRALAADPRWTCILSIANPGRGKLNPLFPPDLPLIAQGSGNLGDRMKLVFRSSPRGQVLIVGSDVVGMSRRLVAQAFDGLRTHDAVIGPAPDGGYWSIGLNITAGPLPAGLFEDVRWSGPHAMADTIESLGQLRISRAATLHDVDCAADLLACRLPPGTVARISR
jgi:rSAM/selenodomain-associated transferase 1